MPITKTAKRALRSSNRKRLVNDRLRVKLETAMRVAKRDKTKKAVLTAISYTDRAAKKKIMHKNKAANLKSMLSRLASKEPKTEDKTNKTSKKK